MNPSDDQLNCRAMRACHEIIRTTVHRAALRLARRALEVAASKPWAFEGFLDELQVHGAQFRMDIDPVLLLLNSITFGTRRIDGDMICSEFVSLAGSILERAAPGPQDDLEHRVNLAVGELIVSAPGQIADAAFQAMIGIDA